MSCTPQQYCLGDKTTEDKTGSVYGTHGTADIHTQDFDEKTSRSTYSTITLQKTSGIR